MLVLDQEGELKHVETGLCLDKGDGAAGSEVGKQLIHPYLAVLRIRDVYPGSRILIFTHPGSRIQKQQQKRGVKKKVLSYLFCSHKFHKIENYFIFEMYKKKIWANF
jgi:hypothetical protein